MNQQIVDLAWRIRSLNIVINDLREGGDVFDHKVADLLEERRDVHQQYMNEMREASKA